MHKRYIFSQSIAPTCFGHFWPSSSDHHTVHVLLHRTLETSQPHIELFNFNYLQHDCWVLDDIFVNNCICDECTYSWFNVLCNDGQKWPKHVGAMNWENIYHLCILLFSLINRFYIRANFSFFTGTPPFYPTTTWKCVQEWRSRG
jgi:hypothetical protein